MQITAGQKPSELFERKGAEVWAVGLCYAKKAWNNLHVCFVLIMIELFRPMVYLCTVLCIEKVLHTLNVKLI